MLPRFRVDGVRDGAAAIAACERVSYDALVVDVCLGLDGDRSGLDLVATLRASGHSMVIVLLSGMEADVLGSLAKRVRADAAIVKGDLEGSSLRSILQNLVEARSRSTESDLSPPLNHLVQDVLDTNAEALSLEAERAYRMALLARGAYGDGRQFAASAKAVGLSRQALQPYILVASRWTSEELRSLLAERRNADGKPISVSHLQLMARLPRRARAEWVERVFAESLTVSELQELLRAVPRQ